MSPAEPRNGSRSGQRSPNCRSRRRRGPARSPWTYPKPTPTTSCHRRSPTRSDAQHERPKDGGKGTGPGKDEGMMGRRKEGPGAGGAGGAAWGGGGGKEAGGGGGWGPEKGGGGGGGGGGGSCPPPSPSGGRPQ